MIFQQKASPEFRLAVGKVLERQRKRLKIYEHEVATLAGVRQSQICNYESGAVCPSMPVLFRLVEILKIDIKELMALLPPLIQLPRNHEPTAKQIEAWRQNGRAVGCLTTRIRRGKPCICGRHTNLVGNNVASVV